MFACALKGLSCDHAERQQTLRILPVERKEHARIEHQRVVEESYAQAGTKGSSESNIKVQVLT